MSYERNPEKEADIFIDYLSSQILDLSQLHQEMYLRDLKLALRDELTFSEVMEIRLKRESRYEKLMESKCRELKERKDKYGYRSNNNNKEE